MRNVPGLEFTDEEEIAAGDGVTPTVYLLVPDVRALADLLSMWQRWQSGRPLDTGLTPWRDVFATLRALRPWGPGDRVTDEDREILLQEVAALTAADTVRVEFELVFRRDPSARARAETAVVAAIAEAGGTVLDQSHIETIAYHALLSELPGTAVRAITERESGSIAWLDPVMHIRPQAVSFSTETADPTPAAPTPTTAPSGTPLVALLDGVPVSEHPLLGGRLRVEDVFDLEATTLTSRRHHGTAMASLIVHGDRNRQEDALRRPVAVVPVMAWDGHDESLPRDKLIVDVIYRALHALRLQDPPLAADVLIVNLSLGNVRRPFHGQMSSWARLLDRMAWELGVLIVVSAGNVPGPVAIPGFDTGSAFEDASPADRAAATSAIANVAPDRRLISPAETINGLTIGASNEDAVSPTDRRTARVNVDPFPDIRMVNPSSRLGPGFADAVKPDALMPGAREHFRPIVTGGGLEVQPAQAARAFGLRIAAPSTTQSAVEHYTNGTSAAAALASRTCHLIHDALADAYGEGFSSLPAAQRALCLKALFVHGARWPAEAYELITRTIGPHGPGQASKQKDNVRRFCGHGVVDPTDVVAGAADRATFWSVGMLGPEEAKRVDVPIPACVSGQALPHEMIATLAWFTPILPGRKSYRTVRLSILEPTQPLQRLRLDGASDQPDQNQIRRGTVASRRWTGNRAPIVGSSESASIIVQRNPDHGLESDEPVPFALVVTLSMPTVITLYDEVRTMIAAPTRVRA